MVVPELAERAFRRFFEEQYVELARLASLLTGEAAVADDLAADAFAQIRVNWERAGGSLRSARGVMVAVAREWDRKQRRAARPARPANDVRTALKQLPFRQRACVVLHYGFGLTELELVDTLGLSAATVRRRTNRGAAQLAALLGEPVRRPAPVSTAILARAGGGTAGHGRHRRWEP